MGYLSPPSLSLSVFVWFGFSRFFGEGLTFFNDKIIFLTWNERLGHVFDLDFKPLATFQQPSVGWGLTHDDNHLIMSDGSDTLFFLDPSVQRQPPRILTRPHLHAHETQNNAAYLCRSCVYVLCASCRHMRWCVSSA